MKETVVRVDLGARSYDVRIGRGLLARAGEAAAGLGLGPRSLVVADAGAAAHAEAVAASLGAAGVDVRLETVPPGEASKTVREAARLWDALAAHDRGVRPFVVAVGGGVVGDLAGFVAATWRRGVPWIACPTTLLAMVDASVGGKTGIDHPAGKNLIGAIHQPAAVLADLETLRTLPAAERRSGLSEVAKHAILGDADLFEALERGTATDEEMVVRSVRLKASIVAEDERDERGRRALLNLGHTFGHALEAAADYKGRHGEAVAVGLVAAARLAVETNRIGRPDGQRIEALVERLGLRARWSGDLDRVCEAMRSDKKSVAGRLRFVLPTGIGRAAVFDDVPADAARRVLEGLRA